MASRVGDHLGAVFEMQPLQDLAHMIADSWFTQVESVAHLLIGHTLRDQGEDFPLAGGQFIRSVFHRHRDVLCQTGEFIEHPDGQFRR